MLGASSEFTQPSSSRASVLGLLRERLVAASALSAALRRGEGLVDAFLDERLRGIVLRLFERFAILGGMPTYDVDAGWTPCCLSLPQPWATQKQAAWAAWPVPDLYAMSHAGLVEITCQKESPSTDLGERKHDSRAAEAAREARNRTWYRLLGFAGFGPRELAQGIVGGELGI